MTRILARAALMLVASTAAPLAVSRAQTAAAQSAAAHPNFSGTWELNIPKSTFGEQGAPTSATLVLTHAGDKLTRVQSMVSPMGAATNTMHTAIGTAATVDTITMMGQSMPFTSTARWDGATLVIDGKVAVQGMDIPVVGRYTLSPDGKQLMIDQVVSTPMGEQTAHYVYDKKG